MVAADTIWKAFQDEKRMEQFFTKEEDDEELEEEEDYEDEEESGLTILHSGVDLPEFEQNIKDSWIYEDLHKVRNAKPAMHGLFGGAFGFYGMMAYTGFTS